MRREHSIRQSVAISVALLSALFLLPLVVIAPFQTELFGEEDAVWEDGAEGTPGRSGGGDGSWHLSGRGGPGGDAGLI